METAQPAILRQHVTAIRYSSSSRTYYVLGIKGTRSELLDWANVCGHIISFETVGETR
jgi:hypothetical protein